ncbi:MFS transporter [Nocardia sp. NPDC056952]|uniref:MFS transporter n=1 Tax=Nocardia sp. NPDC056952 TaxID=3345979 RepID=UPI003634E828
MHESTIVPVGSRPDLPASSLKQHAEARGMFAAFAIRNYRYYFAGQVVSNTGTWMQRIAQDWLVLDLTGSSFAVGITTAMQFLPILLFGLYGGVIADRFSRRGLLMITQAVMGLLAAILAVLTLIGMAKVWHVYLLALLLGMVTVVDIPSRQSFVPEIVGQRRLHNAISLNSASFQAARLVGPAVAGALIAAVGSGWAFAINACSFLAVIGALLAMQQSELIPAARPTRRKGQVREGLRYVSAHPQLLGPIVLVAFVGTFAYNFPVVLSGFAYDVFDVDAGRYGLLNTALAMGSLMGALLASRRGRIRMRMLVSTAICLGALETVVAFAPQYWFFTALLVLVGLVVVTFDTSSNSMLQLEAEPAMRGRVMSLNMIVFSGGTPIGGPAVGWLAEEFGPRFGLFACGAISAISAALVGMVFLRVTRVRVQISGGRIALLPGQMSPDAR